VIAHAPATPSTAQHRNGVFNMVMLQRTLVLSSTASLAALALAMGASAAQAQTADQSAVQGDTPELAADEIVVTAQKRAERLQDVPLSVTAVSGDTLGERQINDTASLVRAVPALTFQQGNHPANTTFRVRGVGTALFGQGVESSVAVVVDGVPLARQAQAVTDLADIERVEVLRGPQGTLFGKNASAGLINIVTARPARDLEGSGEVTIAERGEYRARGTMSGPLSDALRARISGFYNDVEGPAYNVNLQRRVNGSSAWGLRGKLEWDATSNLNFLLTGEYRQQNSDCCTFASIQIVNPVIRQLEAPVVASPTNRLVTEDTPNRADTDQTSVSLQADWDVGAATITSLTAFQNFNLFVNQPIDRLNTNPVLYVGAAAPYASWNFNQGILHLKQFSQELRIASNGSGDLTYVAGLFYSHGDIERPFARRRAVCSVGTTIGEICAAPTYQSSSSFARLKTDNVAAFAQIEYRLAGGLKAIGGLRVQYETGENYGIQLGVVNAGDTLLPGVASGSGTLRDSDTAVTGKAGLQYEFHRDLQMYATYTNGYKGLGYDMEAGANFTQQRTLAPERVNAYEIGMKGRTLDGMLSYALSVYRSDYSNLQVQANRSNPVTGVVQFVSTNAGSSRAQGVELEATLRPADGLSIQASISYTDSTVNIDGLNCPLQFQAGAPTLDGNFPVNSCYRARTTVNGVTTVSGPRQDLRNATLPSSPKWRIGFAPRQDFDIGASYGGFVQFSVNYQSSQGFAIEQDPLLVQKAYAMVDGSIGLYTSDKRYNLSIFVKNLFDQNYYSAMAHNSLLATAASPNDVVASFNRDADRYFGATFGVRF
jgi:iron complex outermembrane receptor protein